MFLREIVMGILVNYVKSPSRFSISDSVVVDAMSHNGYVMRHHKLLPPRDDVINEMRPALGVAVTTPTTPIGSNNNGNNDAPVLVIGPEGSGKTSLIADVVNRLNNVGLYDILVMRCSRMFSDEYSLLFSIYSHLCDALRVPCDYHHATTVNAVGELVESLLFGRVKSKNPEENLAPKSLFSMSLNDTVPSILIVMDDIDILAHDFPAFFSIFADGLPPRVHVIMTSTADYKLQGIIPKSFFVTKISSGPVAQCEVCLVRYKQFSS